MTEVKRKSVRAKGEQQLSLLIKLQIDNEVKAQSLLTESFQVQISKVKSSIQQIIAAYQQKVSEEEFLTKENDQLQQTINSQKQKGFLEEGSKEQQQLSGLKKRINSFDDSLQKKRLQFVAAEQTERQRLSELLQSKKSELNSLHSKRFDKKIELQRVQKQVKFNSIQDQNLRFRFRECLRQHLFQEHFELEQFIDQVVSRRGQRNSLIERSKNKYIPQLPTRLQKIRQLNFLAFLFELDNIRLQYQHQHFSSLIQTLKWQIQKKTHFEGLLLSEINHCQLVLALLDQELKDAHKYIEPPNKLQQIELQQKLRRLNQKIRRERLINQNLASKKMELEGMLLDEIPPSMKFEIM